MRREMFQTVSRYVDESEKVLLFGDRNLTDRNNEIVFKAVHKYIRQIKRFSPSNCDTIKIHMTGTTSLAHWISILFYQSPLILTELFQHNLINVSYLTACYLYQVMMTLHFLNDVANQKLRHNC